MTFSNLAASNDKGYIPSYIQKTGYNAIRRKSDFVPSKVEQNFLLSDGQGGSGVGGSSTHSCPKNEGTQRGR